MRHDVLDFLKGKDTDTFHSQEPPPSLTHTHTHARTHARTRFGASAPATTQRTHTHTHTQASVVGLTYQEGIGKSEGCKFLLLAERGSLTFLVGKWHEWKRATKAADADPEDDDNVERLTQEESRAVEAAFEKTDVFRTMDSVAQVKVAADKVSSKGPPLLNEARIAAVYAERARKAEKGAQPKKPGRSDFFDLVTGAERNPKEPRLGKGKGKGKGTQLQGDAALAAQHAAQHAAEVAAEIAARAAEPQRF